MNDKLKNPQQTDSELNDNTLTQQQPATRYSLANYLPSLILWDLFESALKYVNYIKNLWSHEESVARSEDRFLRCLSNRYYRYYVNVSEECKIWTLSTLPDPQTNSVIRTRTTPPVVLIHGFLSGLAFYAMNIDNIVDSGHDVYAIDLPGYARSSRVQFSDDPDETERIFVEILEKWRLIVGIDRMVLVGHSFGGYITTLYSIFHSDHVSQIVLVDPWGFPDLREEVTAVVESSDRHALSTPLFALPVWMRIMVMILMPFSPFSFIRLGGRFAGPRLIQMLRPDMTRRYSCIFGEDDLVTVPEYIFYTNSFSPTGEEAFRSLAMPLAWAKNPMIKRIGKIGHHIKVHFIYGSRSWIDYQTGFEVKNILKHNHVTVRVLEGAGHHLYADQPELFNEIVRHILGVNLSSNDHDNYNSANSSDIFVKDVSMKYSF